VACGALEALVGLVAEGEGEGSPRRIALFSLGNLAPLPPCRPRLRALHLLGMAQGIAAGGGDAELVRYAQRVAAKLEKE